MTEPKMSIKQETETDSGATRSVGMLNIPKFEKNSCYGFLPWIKLFDEYCAREKLDDKWKQENILNYVDNTVSSFIINTELYRKEYHEMKNILVTVFAAERQDMIREFEQLKLFPTGDLFKFFSRKIDLGRALNYSDQAIIEHLTLSCPPQLRTFLILRDFKTPFEWLEIAKKIFVQQTQEEQNRLSQQNSNPIETNTRPRFYSPRRDFRFQPRFQNSLRENIDEQRHGPRRDFHAPRTDRFSHRGSDNTQS